MAGYDAILLDVDNRPRCLTRQGNDRLYSPAGLQAAKRALRPGGILRHLVCSRRQEIRQAIADTAGFAVDEVAVRARVGGKGPRHIIWLRGRVDLTF